MDAADGGAGTALAFAAAVTVARGAGGSLLARQLALIPLALPHVAGALAALLLLGQSGFLSRAAHAVGWIDGPAEFPAMVYDPAGIGLTLAFAWKEFPFLLLNAIAVLDSRDRTLEETARSLGADASQTWRRVTWPLLWRGMAPAVIAVFAFLVGQYEMAVLLAPSDPLPLSRLTQERAVDPDLARRGRRTRVTPGVAPDDGAGGGARTRDRIRCRGTRMRERRPAVAPAVWFVALAAVSLAPVALLVLRALARTWLYPTLSPVVADGVPSPPCCRCRACVAPSWRAWLLALGTGVLATAMGCAAGARAGACTRRLATRGDGGGLPAGRGPPIALGVGIQVVALRLGWGTLGGVMLAHLIPAAGYVTLYFVGALQGRTLRSRTKRARWGDALANDVARDDPGAALTAARRLRARRPGVVGAARADAAGGGREHSHAPGRAAVVCAGGG
ncbi:MAG: ABC transporter permease subunit [Gemmatimonadetes bacterium]|nr:ABC transporter permease subunit [Gemmatimonadota bacterium]